MKTTTSNLHGTNRSGYYRAGSFLKTTGLLALLGCCSLQRAEADSTGKPEQGYLKVFSSTLESQWGEGSYYQLHTSYQIFDAKGVAVKFVENHDGSTDEDPSKVALTPGCYTVWAQSDAEGLVRIPVEVKTAQTTAVHLEKGSENVALKAAPAAKTKCHLLAKN